MRVDAQVLALKALVPLAPLHQPFALEAMEILLREQPELPQVASFDTAVHRSLPLVEQVLPLPYAAFERGVRRYGFHALSYEYMALALGERYGAQARGRTAVAVSWPPRSAGWTCWSSRPASANTAWRCASASARHWAGWAWRWTTRPTRAMPR